MVTELIFLFILERMRKKSQKANKIINQSHVKSIYVKISQNLEHDFYSKIKEWWKKSGIINFTNLKLDLHRRLKEVKKLHNLLNKCTEYIYGFIIKWNCVSRFKDNLIKGLRIVNWGSLGLAWNGCKKKFTLTFVWSAWLIFNETNSINVVIVKAQPLKALKKT